LGEPKTLPDQATQAISRHGVASGFDRYRETHASMRESVGFDAKSEESIVDAPATGIDRIELQLAAQAQLRTKT
jgi:hypothetical protein